MAGVPPITLSDGRVIDIVNASHEDLKTARIEIEKEKISATPSQKALLRRFVSDDEIEYELKQDHELNKKNGAGGIDTEGADQSNNKDSGVGFTASAAAGGAAAASVAVLYAVIEGAVDKAAAAGKVNGWIAAIAGGVAMAGGALAWAMSGRKTFDPGSDIREQFKNKAAENNQLMDDKKDTLEMSMDMMNEDIEAYEEGNEELSFQLNTKAAEGANLEQEIADAESLGDTKKAAELRKQLTALNQNNFEDKVEELAETREGLTDYQVYNDESVGLAESGDQVAKFLQFGNELSGPANKAKVVLMVGAIGMALAAAIAQIPKVWTMLGPLDGVSAVVAGLLMGTAAAMMGKAAGNFGENAKFEAECGSAGNEMSTHVSDLSTMATEQYQYIETTTGSYDESDEKQEEIREEGQKAADELNPNKGGKTVRVDKPKKDEEDKKEEKDGNPVIK